MYYNVVCVYVDSIFKSCTLVKLAQYNVQYSLSVNQYNNNLQLT